MKTVIGRMIGIVMRSLFGSFLVFRRLGIFLAVPVLPLLAACNLAPGMNINSEVTQPGVTPVLKEITPQLLQEEREARDRFTEQTVNALFSDPKPYRVGINDVVSVVLFGQHEMTSNVSVMMAPIPNTAADSLVTSGYAVDSEGQIHLQYVGAVKVAGLTELEMHDLLVQEYSKYIKKPELNVRVESYRSKRLYVDGEIKNPGVLPIIDIPMTLPEALSRAGGATTLGNLGSVDINRAGKRYVVNVPQLTAHGVDPSRILLENGDLVRVPRARKARCSCWATSPNPAHCCRTTAASRSMKRWAKRVASARQAAIPGRSMWCAVPAMCIRWSTTWTRLPRWR